MNNPELRWNSSQKSQQGEKPPNEEICESMDSDLTRRVLLDFIRNGVITAEPGCLGQLTVDEIKKLLITLESRPTSTAEIYMLGEEVRIDYIESAK